MIKKSILLTSMLILLMGLTSSFSVSLKADDSSVSGKWINIQITNTETKKDELKIRVPVALIEWAQQFDEDDDLDIEFDSDCKINFTNLVDILIKKGVTTILKVEDYEDHKIINIWID